MWRNNERCQRVFVLIALMLALTVLIGCGNNARGEKEIVATYNGGQVTQAEFDAFKSVIALIDPMFAELKADPGVQQNLLEQLISLKILQSRAIDEAKKDAEPKVKEQMDQYIKYLEQQYGSKKKLDKHLKELQITRDDIRNYIERSVVVITDMEKKISDQQIKDQFDQKIQSDKHFYDVATVSHILVGFEGRSKEEALGRAKEVKEKLKNGGDFVVLAKEYSDDPGSRDRGGKYEKVEIQRWAPEFRKAAGELPLNQISDPIETVYGYHVMKVESRTSRGYVEVSGQIRANLAENLILDFVKNELPALIEKTNLPAPEGKK